jgi:hypothetical protein
VSVATLSDWTLQREQGAWHLYEGMRSDSDVALSVPRASAVSLFSRGLTVNEVTEAVTVEGDAKLGGLIVAGLGAAFARTDR